MLARLSWLSLCLLVAWSGRAAAQPAAAGPDFGPYDDLPQILTVLSPLLLPKIMADTWSLRAYVRSDEFHAVRVRWGDRYAVDAIFDHAVRLCWNNRALALLLSCMATMDHRRVGVELPLIGALVWLPLTSEFEEEFRERVHRLPCKIYPDTGPGGCDRDKLQHFFGSAFLAFITESREAAQRVGDFVEWGEERFVVDGATEALDIRANHQGQMFGLALLNDPDCRPSAFLVAVLAAPPPPQALPGTPEE